MLTANTEAIANPVNCVGVMGKGLALQFKQNFPDNYSLYKQACDQSLVQPGEMFVFYTGLAVPEYIINFPTKRHWREKSKIEYIYSGLENLSTA